MRLTVRTYLCCAHRMSFLIGCALGIALSLILMPLIEEKCIFYARETGFVEAQVELRASDDYEPVLIVNGKLNSHGEKSQLLRPRYYSTELNIREKLFVAIISTSSTISTLGSALNRTVSTHAEKVVFFLEGGDSSNANSADSSIVKFEDKRPVLTPFYMLQHIADHFLDDYDFFFFAKDTTHIRGSKLHDYVSHISISQSVHVGEPIEDDSLYCTMEAGILLSRNVVVKMVKDLDWCIQHAFSDSSSDNVGRCILHGTQQPCMSFAQGLNFVSHSVTKSDNLESSILKSSWAQDLKQTITLYPVTNIEDHYLIHHYFCHQELVDNQADLLQFEQKILGIRSSQAAWPIGIEPSFKPRSRFDMLNWVYFNDTHSFLPSEQTGVSLLQGLHKMEVQDVLKSAIHWVQSNNKDKCIYQRMVNGYKRFDPARGTEYMLDLVFLEDSTGNTVFKRVEAVRPLNEVEIVPVPFVTEHSRIILLIFAKSNDRDCLLKFIDDYEKACLEKQDSTALLIVFIYGPQDPIKSGSKDDIFDKIKNSVSSLTTKYRSNGAKIAWLSTRSIGKTPPVYAMVDLVSRKLATDSMILLCRIGMEIHSDYLNRVRMNTILKTQVFFPIPYVQYHPSLSYKHLTPPDTIEVKKDLGHFDSSSYNHASFYLSDYLNMRKRFENRVPIVRTDKDLKNNGLYDKRLDIYDMFLESDLHVMRSVEPDLRLRFTMDLCDPDLPTVVHEDCLENWKNRLGSKSQLAASVLSRESLDITNEHSDVVE